MPEEFGTGCIPDSYDPRDLKHEEVVGATPPPDYKAGFDVEKKLNIKIPFKNQFSSLSCVGQGWAYYFATVHAAKTGVYDEVSAKAIYSQIFLPQGGAMIRDGGMLLVKFGAVLEKIISSYKSNDPADEAFMEDKSWITPEVIAMAKTLQAMTIVSINPDMDSVASAIRDYYGVVLAVNGENNGTWSSNEPQPPVNTIWRHCMYFGKFGLDKLNNFISSPNSWGTRNAKDELHPDDWQKLRINWFSTNNVSNVWALIDKPLNKPTMPRLIKDANSPSVGFWIPALNETELLTKAKELNISIPTKANGSIDWTKVKLDGKAILN